MCNAMDYVEHMVFQLVSTKMDIEFSTNVDLDLQLVDINSIDFIEILVELEEAFEISFKDEELDFDKYSTVRDIVTVVKQHIQIGPISG